MSAEGTGATPGIVQMLLAMERWGTSDLFVCEGKVPAVRLHGVVVKLELPPTPASALEDFLARELSPETRQRYLDTGDLDMGLSPAHGKRFRINLARQQGRHSLVARAIPSGALDLTSLGLPEAVAQLAHLTRGLVLVTGATGSGKSTTLSAMIHHINRERAVHVVTLEEPIEFVHEDQVARITQREIGHDTVSFEMALRQVLRESPDVILIGELRDVSSIRIAIQAALTGHLVLATLHTIDTAQTLQRIMSYFSEEQRPQISLDLSLSLKGIVSQRLLPRSDGEGRVAAVEVLSLSPASSQLIREQRLDDLADFMKGSTDPSVIPFHRALLELFRNGAIDYETGVAYASNAEEFALGARGMTTGVTAFRGDVSDRQASTFDIKSLLAEMSLRGASDLHLSVGHPPTFRIHGVLQVDDTPPLSAADVRILLFSILGVRQRGVYELEREIDFALALEDGRRYRVNAYYERGHMAAAFRAIRAEIPSAEELGLPRALLDMGNEPQGLLLFVGPTGSGKTTSMACLIDRINRSRKCHIITIEDPIEYVHASHEATVHQREVHADTKSFAAALKYILRQDPDVILVGELRDLETISAALTAAETGHLVLATLHTNDAVQTIDRIIDVFPPHQQGQVRSQLAAALIGVVSQRLLPLRHGDGQIGAFELMRATTAVRALIRDNKMHQAASVMQASRGVGMITLDAALEELVRKGLVKRSEATRHMRNPSVLNDVPEED
jgi:twitching motility protein PilT